MEQHSPSRPPCILVVDNDESSRAVLEQLFQRVGWTYDLVSTHREAVAAAGTRNYDVVIADIILFGSESVPFVRMMRERNPEQAVIVITKKENLVEAERLLEEGAVDCVERPLDSKTLEESVNQLISEISQAAKINAPPRHNPPRPLSMTECFSSRELCDQGYHFPVVQQLFDDGVLDLNGRLKLTLAFQEALTNSIEHGNLELRSEWKEEPGRNGHDRYHETKRERLIDSAFGNRKITILTDFDGSRLLVRITDEGKGFLPSEAQSSKRGRDDLPVFGRGLAIMNGSLDEVRFSMQGRQVTMVKRFQ